MTKLTYLAAGTIALGLAGPALAQMTASPAANAAIAGSMDVAARMQVQGSDRKFVGTVDAVEPTRIILTRSDPVAQGEHHAIPRTAIAGVANDTVMLNMTSDQAFRSWNAVAAPAADAKR